MDVCSLLRRVICVRATPSGAQWYP